MAEVTMASFRGDPVASLYSASRDRGWRSQVISKITGRSRSLLSLAQVAEKCAVVARRDAGVRTVAIDDIRGSEARCNDFDCDFNPLRDHTGGRWLRLARACWDGWTLPPVDLIEVGGTYFVRDGSHRISVARALGQRYVEAEVVIWHVEGTQPWESAGDATRREPSIGALCRGTRDRVFELSRRFLLTIRAALTACGIDLTPR